MELLALEEVKAGPAAEDAAKEHRMKEREVSSLRRTPASCGMGMV